MQKREVIFSLIKHPSLGYWPEAYWVNYLENGEMAFDFEKAVSSEVTEMPEYIQENVKICEDIHPESMMKKFNTKKKIHPLEWLEKIKDEKGAAWDLLASFYGKKMYHLLDNLKGKWIGFREKMDQHPGLVRKNISPDQAYTNFIFEKTNDGTKYTLGLKLKQNHFEWKQNAVIINDFPCFLMTGNYIYQVSEPATGKQLRPFFKKDYILIDKKNENSYYEKFILKVIKEQSYELKNIPVEHKHLKPKKKISLIESPEGLPALNLSFLYGSLSASPELTSKHFTLPIKPVSEKGFAQLHRDFDEENLTVELLKGLGLLQNGRQFTLKSHLKHINNGKNQDLHYELLELITNNNRLLAKHEIEISTEWSKKSFQTEKPRIRTHISNQDADWFDLQIIIEAGKFKIPFWKMKENIITRNREYVLPDKTILLIPEEWFTVLGDLIQLGKRDASLVKLKPVHLQWINEKNTIPGLDKPIKKHEKIYSTSIPEINLPADWKPTLRPYQVSGYRWLCHLAENGYGGVLADDMGLGKTIQLLAFIKKQKDRKSLMQVQNSTVKSAEQTLPQLSLFDNEDEESAPFICLVILPTSLIFNWQEEIMKFVPELKVYVHTGQNRSNSNAHWKDYDLVLTSYGLARNDEDLFRSYRFDLIIADESHYIKNPDSKTYRSISMLNADKKIAVTGTPVENGLSDLWSQMTFVNPGLLGGFKSFKENFIVPIEKQDDQHIRKKLQSITAPFLLRRKKADVAADLPDLTQEITYCEMTDHQYEMYESEKSKYRNKLLDRLSKGSLNDAENRFFVLKGLNLLRQIANHPKLTDETYSHDSGKFSEVLNMLEVLHEQGHKVLVFSQFVKHLELVRAELDKQERTYGWLTGSVKDRKAEVDLFQQNPDCQTFLISLKAGGVGLNLTAADYVLILDPWWNPAAEEQALNRAHRIGSKNKVMVYRFITKGSIEEKIKVLQKRKQDLSDQFSGSANPVKYMSDEEVKNLFE